MTPQHPSVTYIWGDAAPTSHHLSTLNQLLPRVVRLGHSASFVSLRTVERHGTATWRPAQDGEMTLRVVQAGQLAALERAFLRHRETESRVLPSVPQSYSRRNPETVQATAASLFSDEWVVLRRLRGPSFPITATVGIARAVRKTLMSFAEEPIPEMLSGHAETGEPSRHPHMAIVPLPFVGHERASGLILGVAFVLPRTAGDADRRAVYSAVANWEAPHRQEDEDAPVIPLTLGAAGQMFLERVEWGAPQTSLRPSTWCGPSLVWRSVTPIALDRNPGDLSSRDVARLDAATQHAVETISVACERIGLPRPLSVEILPAAPLAGAAKARDYPAFPGAEGRTQRLLTHARLEFQDPVRGPIVLGAGRFLGLGLCRPDVAR
jgi:CRISPR-associated protein Csb2